MPERLGKAEAFGTVPVDLRAGAPVEQIRQVQPARRDSPAHREERVMGGRHPRRRRDRLPARGNNDLTQENPRPVIQNVAKLVDPGGRTGVIGVIGIFPESGPKGTDPLPKGGDMPCHEVRSSARASASAWDATPTGGTTAI